MGISDATFYKWRKKYGGLGPLELRRLRQLEEENNELKRLVADLSLDKAMLTCWQKNSKACRVAGLTRRSSAPPIDSRVPSMPLSTTATWKRRCSLRSRVDRPSESLASHSVDQRPSWQCIGPRASPKSSGCCSVDVGRRGPYGSAFHRHRPFGRRRVPMLMAIAVTEGNICVLSSRRREP